MEYGYSSTSKIPVQLCQVSGSRHVSKLRSSSLEPAPSATKILYATVKTSVTTAKHSMDNQQKDVSLPNSTKKPEEPETSVEDPQNNKEVERPEKILKYDFGPSNDKENSMDDAKKNLSLPNSNKKQNPEKSAEDLQNNKEMERPGKILKYDFSPSNDEENSVDGKLKDVSQRSTETFVGEVHINKIIERPGKMLKYFFSLSNDEGNSMDNQQKDVPWPNFGKKQKPGTSVVKVQLDEKTEYPGKIMIDVFGPSDDEENSKGNQQKDVSLPNSNKKQNPETSVEKVQINKETERTGKILKDDFGPWDDEETSMDDEKKDVSLPNSTKKKKVPKVWYGIQKRRKSLKSKIRKSQEVELQTQLDDMQLQRDFYYSKCLRVEMLCSDPKASTSNEEIQEILYATADRFSPPDEDYSIYI